MGCGIMSYEGVTAKLSAAIESLATSSHQTIQQRLAITYLFHLRSVEPSDLPRAVALEFQELKNKLTKEDDTTLATDTLSLQDAVGIAKDLVRIHHFLTEQKPPGTKVN